VNVTGWSRDLEGLADAAMESFLASVNGDRETVGLLVSDVVPTPRPGPGVRNTRSASSAATDSGRSG
jgi:hypothetical protein